MDLSRSDQKLLPVNLVYPPNYPEEPCIMLPSLFGPSEALEVLARMEKIQNGGGPKTTQAVYQQ